jgi:hypothetical protein
MEHQRGTPTAHAAAIHDAYHRLQGERTPQDVRRGQKVHLLIGHEDVFLQAFSLSASANRQYRAAKILANKLRATGLIGSVAAVGPLPVDDRYVAYLSNVQSFAT